tara:strand:- start:85 stop:321 length:237 start_codon:yes stop_codon:yes gene_type:complete
MVYLNEILDVPPPKLNIIDRGARIPGGETSIYGEQLLRVPGKHIGKLYGFEADEPTCSVFASTLFIQTKVFLVAEALD